MPFPAHPAPILRIDDIVANYRIPTAKAAPSIDGDLSDPVWKNALRIDTFFRMAGDAPVVEKTDAWVTTDGENIYIAFHCHDSRPDLIRQSETQRGSRGVYGDDHITVMIDSQDQRRGNSSFSVNPIGTQLESLEGGTAGNITWAGDWKAAAKAVDDGWTCELAIPWRLMRYRAGSKSFGLMLLRFLNRESNPVVWPQLPPEGQNWNAMGLFRAQMSLPAPLPAVRPKPVILPYSLTTVGPNHSRGRVGVDVKIPLDTTITGLVAVQPDFQTVEQDVANVNLSYNEQFVADRRPFFAEGAEFLPDSELFYTRRIGIFDQGLKVVGRQGPTSIGFVASQTDAGPMDRDAVAFQVRQNTGLLGGYGVEATRDQSTGRARNEVARVSAYQGWITGDRRTTVNLHHTQSWVAGTAKGRDSEFGIRSGAGIGKLRWSFARDWMSKDFESNLGLLFNRDRNDWRGRVSIGNQFDRGPIFNYEVEASAERAVRDSTGDFFYDSQFVRAGGQLRNGLGAGIDFSRGKRKEDASTLYNDRFSGLGIGWNQRSLFQQGGFRFGSGRQAGLSIRNFSFSQGIPLTRDISLFSSFNQQRRDRTTVRQTIVTGVWRIDTLRAFSLRLVSQNGTGNALNVGAQTGTNLYAAFSQRSRSGGADWFLLLGDPNAPSTRSQVTVKVTRPF